MERKQARSPNNGQASLDEGEFAGASVVMAAQKGDRRAFDELAVRFWPRIYRMVYFRVFSQTDAEDLTQEVFIRAYENIAKLDAPEKFKAWLFSIAINLVRDFRRKRRVLAFIGLSSGPDEPDRAETGPSAVEALLSREFWKHVRDFSNKLPSSEREVFTLRFMDQLSIREISETLGKNESSVKTHLYRAVKKFKDKKGLLELLQGEER